jgi:hypothetical protein
MQLRNTRFKFNIGAEGAQGANRPAQFVGSMTAAVRELQGRGIPRTPARETLHKLTSNQITGTELKNKEGATVAISIAA